MARIIGTPEYDYLEGTDNADVIHGRGGGDLIYGLGGDDRLFGDNGNDFIDDQVGRNEIWGGPGDDHIQFARGIARGGLGNDLVHVSGGGWAGGGDGNDFVSGRGYLCGDALPGGDTSIVGNDTLLLDADADGVRAIGGLGADSFKIVFPADAVGIAIVEDFTPGQDRMNVTTGREGEEDIDLFATFDGNHNGVLEYTDSLSGGGVYVDITTNTMYLVHGASLAIIHGATSISQADWLFE